MPRPPSPRARTRSLPAWLLLAALAFAGPSPARADELEAIAALLAQGSVAEATTRLEGFLSRQPKDARARFLRARLLAGQQRETEAMAAYRALIDEFPELPEPYNNLAALHAARGQFDEARRLLEMAIRAHPGFSTAWENLGDLHARLAWEAYGQAQGSGGPVSASLGERRERLREVFTAPGTAPPALAPTPALSAPAARKGRGSPP